MLVLCQQLVWEEDKWLEQFFGYQLVDKVGHHKLLLWSAVTMCVAAAILNSKPYCEPGGTESDECIDVLVPLSLIGVILYGASFQAAWACLPYLYLVATEIIPLQVKGIGTGLVTFFGWFSAGVCLLTYEPYQDAVTLWVPYITFSFIMFCAVLFVYKFVPETKGKTLEEITFLKMHQTLLLQN